MRHYEVKRKSDRWELRDVVTGERLIWSHAKQRLLPEVIRYLKTQEAHLEVKRLNGSVAQTYTFSGVLDEEPGVRLHPPKSNAAVEQETQSRG